MRRLLFLISLLALIIIFPGQGLADMATVTVEGAAEIKVPADRVSFELSVVTEAETPPRALQDNSEKMEKILKALQRNGLKEEEVNTGQFLIAQRWSQRPRQAPDDWKPSIVGYTVTNQLKIETVQLALIGEVISAAVKAGSNNVGSLNFDLSNPQPYRQEAIRLATTRAQEDAKVLADAAGMSLGPVVSLNLDNARAVPIALRANMMHEAAGSSMAPPVIPGDVKVRVNVTAVYSLK